MLGLRASLLAHLQDLANKGAFREDVDISKTHGLRFTVWTDGTSMMKMAVMACLLKLIHDSKLFREDSKQIVEQPVIYMLAVDAKETRAYYQMNNTVVGVEIQSVVKPLEVLVQHECDDDLLDDSTLVPIKVKLNYYGNSKHYQRA